MKVVRFCKKTYFYSTTYLLSVLGMSQGYLINHCFINLNFSYFMITYRAKLLRKG